MVKLWGWDHICTQSCVTSLTKLFVSKDNLDDAQTLYTEALKGTRRAVGSEHPWTSQLQNNNACFCINRNDLSTAETLLRQAVRAKSTVFGPNHGNTLKTKCNLALVSYLSDGASAALEAELLSILAGLKEAWGENNGETKAVAKQLISLYFETENAAAGHQLCRDLKLDRKFLNLIPYLNTSSRDEYFVKTQEQGKTSIILVSMLPGSDLSSIRLCIFFTCI
ncbi:hypothetical protein B0O99DRAFT_347129 [Bisporella sp. PMI_857]|nr:hypothetical protein B0O99DRAFT_347129 [Bisporella sp. PMI_857]